MSRSQRYARRLGLVILSLLLTLGLVEGYYRSLQPQKQVLMLSVAPQENLTPQLLDLTPGEGDRVVHGFDRGQSARIIIRNRAPRLYEPHPLLGKTPLPDTSIRLVKRDQEGEVFDSLMTTDALGRRAGQVRSGPTLLFFGGSFCFGLGVDDDQTLPEQTAAILGGTALNYGVGGYGTHQVLYLLETLPVEDLPEGPRQLIYVFIPDHVRRAIGKFSSFRWNQGQAPCYQVSAEGRAVLKGTWLSQNPWTGRLYTLLEHSFLAKAVGLELPLTMDEADLDTVLSMVGECQILARERWGAQFLVFAYHDTEEASDLGTQFVERLKSRGISVVESGELGAIPRDGHPSAEGHWEAAKVLSEALKD